MQSNEDTQASPIPINEDLRLEELDSFDILYDIPEEGFDAISRLAARICGLPIAMINIIESEEQKTKSCIGIAGKTVRRSESICQYTVMNDEILEINDLARDARFKNRSFVKEEPHLRFYAGAPLKTEGRHNIGSLCVMGYEPNSLTDSQKDSLKTLADEVMVRFRLRKRQKKLEQLNHFKDELMQFVSHDIRNPLSGIVGAADCLKMDKLGEEEKAEMVEIILESAGQIQNIVSEMLDNELVQFGNLKYRPDTYDLYRGIEELLYLFRFSARNKNINLSYSIEEDIPQLYIDGQKYERIVANLISNSIKFTPEAGQVTVSCSYRESEEGENQLTTTVRDSGIGMPEKIQQNLFTKKRETGRSGTNNENSYGIGLDIVKEFAEVCGATIEVESEVDEGSIFTITMPAPAAGRESS